MDVVSGTILDILFANTKLPIALNIVHPHPVTWRSVITNLKQVIQEKGLKDEITVVSISDWLSRLEDRGKNETDEDVKNLVRS